MTLDQLRYALELQKTRHFSQAAENCHIAQPSLSVQIAKLEAELGADLFVRTRAGIEVTEYGEVLLRQARTVIEEAERLQQTAKDLKGLVQGGFRLGVISTLAPSLLPLFVGKFGQQYPQVELSISEERTEKLVSEIDQGLLDGALLSTPAKCPESLMEKVLFYEPFLLFASAGHPILQKKKISVDQISSDEILLLDETHCLRDQVLQLCKSRQRGLSSKSLRIQSASLQTLIELIRHHQGYTLLPAMAAALLTPTEKNQQVRQFDKPFPSRKISLVFHRSRLKRSVVDALKDSIVAHLPKEVYLTGAKGPLRILSPDSEHFEI